MTKLIAFRAMNHALHFEKVSLNRYDTHSHYLGIHRPSAEYKGTCSFNSLTMPCLVSQNPFTLTMRWADGVTETYVHQGNGVFTDKNGGIWTSSTHNNDGILLKQKNGNSISFTENR